MQKWATILSLGYVVWCRPNNTLKRNKVDVVKNYIVSNLGSDWIP